MRFYFPDDSDRVSRRIFPRRAFSRRALLKMLSGAAPPVTASPAHHPVIREQLVLTPNDHFFHRKTFNAPPPHLDPDSWTLLVDGLVARPLVLTYDSLLARPAIEEVRTLVSIANPIDGNLTGNALWRGVDLDHLLRQAGLLPDAERAIIYAADGHSTSLPLDRLTGRRALAAYAMNDKVLRPEHGYPLRLLVPGHYDDGRLRWVKHIRLVDAGHGHSAGDTHVANHTAEIETFAQIARPETNTQLRPGDTAALQGIAFGGTRRITAVEISIDGGDWMLATLVPGPTPLAWTEWRILWQPCAPGEVTVAVRATDESGIASDGAIHQITLRVN